jgi:hypothetical protein
MCELEDGSAKCAGIKQFLQQTFPPIGDKDI